MIYYRVKSIVIGLSLTLWISLPSCDSQKEKSVFDYASVRPHFQQELDGVPIDLYLLENQNGIQVTVTNYGSRIVHLIVPDKEDREVDVVLGFNSLDQYLNSSEPYFGAVVGRYANRIADARFVLNDTEYLLAANNGVNSLHGGPGGYHNVPWEVRDFSKTAITLVLLSPNGDEGFPGNLRVEMTYTLTDENELVMDYQATTDQATPLNLTNHAFFNLNGDGSGDINGHVLHIKAARYTPVNEVLIPTGQIEEVINTPFDFTKAIAIGARVNETHEQLRYGNGYDHNFVLDKGISVAPALVASIQSSQSGINLQVFTSEPGLQFYGGNFLDGSIQGKNGTYEFRGAFCLETQHFPDSPNQAHFPTTILEPGDTYLSRSMYKFVLSSY
ncbi:MAG: galactose mutarotase [Cyclobacteriaceae bacterium]|nr:galactose mutarotase [Cyclobacteriaceae bacterium HetDA_MAG_MS6]